jgi:hypothetical protein
MAEEVTYKEIWGTLSKVSVKGHVEKKMGLSYLSWAWAWGVLMEHYPQAEYRFTEYTVFDERASVAPGLDVMRYHDGSCSVECTITIGSCKRSMWLPVMDHRNNSIPDPSSRQISDAKMRCLVKNIAMFGLGHYLYAGEDTPGEDDSGKAEVQKDPEPQEALADSGETGVVIAYETFVADCKSMKELKDFWRDNRKELSKLEKTDPGKYEGVLKVFTDKKNELAKD